MRFLCSVTFHFRCCTCKRVTFTNSRFIETSKWQQSMPWHQSSAFASLAPFRGQHYAPCDDRHQVPIGPSSTHLHCCKMLMSRRLTRSECLFSNFAITFHHLSSLHAIVCRGTFRSSWTSTALGHRENPNRISCRILCSLPRSLPFACQPATIVSLCHANPSPS